MARVYLDTSFVSACVTTRSDAVSVVSRETSQEWMATQAHQHEVFVSAEVFNELDDAAYRSREPALELIGSLQSLEISDQVIGLATVLVAEKVMPGPIGGDSVHVAVCCIHRVDYLLSWNVRHLANPNKIAHLRTICTRLGLIPPIIVTPDLLWEDTP
jgi:hypothetical protein